jgi:hypothetical protein
MFWLEPPLIVYVNVYGAVPLAPVKVIFGEAAFLQTEVVPDIVAVGNAFTVAFVEPAALVQPVTNTVKLYVPEAAVVAFAIEGFWSVEVKPLGPVHEYVAPVTVGVDRLRVDPAQIGPLLDATGVEGGVLTVTKVEPAGLEQPVTVMVTLYVPAAADVTLAMDGACNVEVNPFGPVQAYAAPDTTGVERLSVEPIQTGLLLEAIGVAGAVLTWMLWPLEFEPCPQALTPHTVKVPGVAVEPKSRVIVGLVVVVGKDVPDPLSVTPVPL